MADPAQPTSTADAERRAAAAQVFVEDPSHPVLAPADEHHLARVLRLTPGELVVATDGAGTWTLCRWGSEVSAPAPALAPCGESRFEPAAPVEVTVAFAPAKGDRPEWVVQKLTELGVDVIVPLVAERGVVRWHGARASQAIERLRRVSLAAAAQCRRVRLPRIAPMATLAELAASVPASASSPVSESAWAMADPEGDPVSLDHPMVAVGPEGGWGPGEVELDLPRVTLSPQVLRSETAAVAAGVLLAALRAGTVAPTVDSAAGADGARGTEGRKGRRSSG